MGNALLEIKAKDVMTTALITVTEDDLMATVEKLLLENNINHIPVVDEDSKLLGILTKNDVQLLKDWATNLGLRTARKSNDQILNSHTASDRMKDDLITISPDDTLRDCVRLLQSNTFHALPVTEGGKLVGIITTFDLLAIAYAETAPIQ